jgi:hypothetical protein
MKKSLVLVLIPALIVFALSGCAGQPVIGKDAKYFNPLDGLPKWVADPKTDDGLAVSVSAPYSHFGISNQLDILDAEARHQFALHMQAIVTSTLDMVRETHKLSNIEVGRQTVKKLLSIEIPTAVLPRLQRKKWYFNENTGDIWGFYTASDASLKDAFRLSLIRAGIEKQFIEEGVAYLDRNISKMKDKTSVQNEVDEIVQWDLMHGSR